MRAFLGRGSQASSPSSNCRGFAATRVQPQLAGEGCNVGAMARLYRTPPVAGGELRAAPRSCEPASPRSFGVHTRVLDICIGKEFVLPRTLPTVDYKRFQDRADGQRRGVQTAFADP